MDLSDVLRIATERAAAEVDALASIEKAFDRAVEIMGCEAVVGFLVQQHTQPA